MYLYLLLEVFIIGRYKLRNFIAFKFAYLFCYRASSLYPQLLILSPGMRDSPADVAFAFYARKYWKMNVPAVTIVLTGSMWSRWSRLIKNKHYSTFGMEYTYFKLIPEQDLFYVWEFKNFILFSCKFFSDC